MLHKVYDDVKCDYVTPLAWAINTKNSLTNDNGFSPSQLVFGRNCNLPNTTNDILPALDKSNYSSDLAKHIYALYAARQAFISLESTNKDKLALKKNICNYQQFHEINEMVYYKRKDSPEWKGPAKVLRQDGPVLFLHQGTRYIKAHVRRVQSIKSASIQHTTPEDFHIISNNTHDIDNQDKTTASFKTNENNNESSDEESTTSIPNVKKQTNISDNKTKFISTNDKEQNNSKILDPKTEPNNIHR